MSSERAVEFRVASEETEFEQVFRLNYRTFVEEIPQHAPNAGRRLVDRFHTENTYLVALAEERLVGMMAVRERRPFSLDEKLANLDDHLPSGRKPCEIRLLAVVPAYRNGRVFQGLLALLLDHARKRRLNLALISGTVRELKLYGRLGFVPFGPLVGPAKAQFQPMFLPLPGPELGDLDLQRLRPMGAYARPRSPGWTALVLADPGQDYVLYLTRAAPAPGSLRTARMSLDKAAPLPPECELDLPAGSYSIEWVDPDTGRGLGRGHCLHAGGSLLLTAPVVAEPLAVRVRRV
jgi:GNAT superfamily N-acetyltransferase